MDDVSHSEVEGETTLSSVLREKAWTLCNNYLQGVWATTTPDEINVRELSGGLSNRIYLCSLPKDVAPLASEPVAILLRLFGQKIPIDADEETTALVFNAHITDNVIFTLLSERKLGPHLYGIFSGGRLEEYIQSESMIGFQLCDIKYCPPIARKMAKIHLLDAPIKKNGTDWIFDTMISWFESVSRISTFNICKKINDQPLVDEVMSFDFSSEIEWLRQVLPQVNSPIVFCHNDFQGGNVLRRSVQPGVKIPIDDQLVVIDFEFCAYNYRAFDIANHWTEWIYDYGTKSYPYYYVEEFRSPTREQRVDFLRSYIKQIWGDISESAARYWIPQGKTRKAGAALNLDQIVEMLLREVELFMAVPNIFWALWAMHQAVYSDIQFGYWHYAANRMEAYFKHKEKMKVILELERNRKMSADISSTHLETSAKRAH